MKQAAASIWKTDNPKTESNSKHMDGKKAAFFIPENYSDPTASAAMRSIMREEKQREIEERRAKNRNSKQKKRCKT